MSRTSVYLNKSRDAAVAASGRSLLQVIDAGLAALGISQAPAEPEAGQPVAPVRLVPLGQQDADGKPVWLYRFERAGGSSCPVVFCSDKGELDEYRPATSSG